MLNLARFLTPQRPQTLEEHLPRMAVEIGYVALELKKSLGKGFIFVERVPTAGTPSSILAHIKGKSENKRVLLRALETVHLEWADLTHRCKLYARHAVPAFSVEPLPLSEAVNAEPLAAGNPFPGGPFSWWNLCSINARKEFEEAFGIVSKELLIKRTQRTLTRIAASNAPFKKEANPPRPLRIMPRKQFWGEPKKRIRGAWKHS